MSLDYSYSDIPGDHVKAVMIMTALGVSPLEITSDPMRFKQFQSIANYFQDIPNFEFLIKKIIIGKNVDTIKHVHEWVTLMKRKTEKEEELIREKMSLDQMGITDEDISFIEDNDIREKYMKSKSNVDTYTQELSNLSQEINLYE